MSLPQSGQGSRGGLGAKLCSSAIDAIPSTPLGGGRQHVTAIVVVAHVGEQERVFTSEQRLEVWRRGCKLFHSILVACGSKVKKTRRLPLNVCQRGIGWGGERLYHCIPVLCWGQRDNNKLVHYS
jgi:hypothetical protein